MLALLLRRWQLNRQPCYRVAVVRDVSIGRKQSLGQGRRQALVFLAGLPDHPARYQVLELLIGSEAQHFLAAARRISRPKVFMEDLKELLKFERSSSGKDCNQLFRNEIRHSA